MEKKYEISLVVIGLFFISFFMLYKWYFAWYCELKSGKNEINYLQSIKTIASCKDSLVCEFKNTVVSARNEVVTWSCEKRVLHKLEWDFYKEKFNKYF